MPIIPPIDDAYINEIIKSTGPYNASLNVTQGVKLRELMKRFRDYYNQQIPTQISQLVNDAGYVTSAQLEGVAYDNEVVHLTGNETIDGLKAFKQPVTSPSYTFHNFGGSESADLMISAGAWGPGGTGGQWVFRALNNTAGYNFILDPSLITAGAGAFRTYRLPDANGTLALLSDIPSASGFVPYTGANNSVDLGTYGIRAGVASFLATDITSNLGYTALTVRSDGDFDTDAVGVSVTSGSYSAMQLVNSSVNFPTVLLNQNSTGKMLSFNKSYAEKSYIDNNGNFVKVGGTSSQFLKADGSVDNNTYVTSSSIAGKANLSGGNTFSGTQLLGVGSSLLLWGGSPTLQTELNAAGVNVSGTSSNSGLDFFGLRLGNGTYSARLAQQNITENRTLYLPNETGTLATQNFVYSAIGNKADLYASNTFQQDGETIFSTSWGFKYQSIWAEIFDQGGDSPTGFIESRPFFEFIHTVYDSNTGDAQLSNQRLKANPNILGSSTDILLPAESGTLARLEDLGNTGVDNAFLLDIDDQEITAARTVFSSFSRTWWGEVDNGSFVEPHTLGSKSAIRQSGLNTVSLSFISLDDSNGGISLALEEYSGTYKNQKFQNKDGLIAITDDIKIIPVKSFYTDDYNNPSVDGGYKDNVFNYNEDNILELFPSNGDRVEFKYIGYAHGSDCSVSVMVSGTSTGANLAMGPFTIEGYCMRKAYISSGFGDNITTRWCWTITDTTGLKRMFTDISNVPIINNLAISIYFGATTSNIGLVAGSITLFKIP